MIVNIVLHKTAFMTFHDLPEFGSENASPAKKRHMIGYARVSTKEQSLDLQRDALIAAGVNPLDIYEDKASGKNMKRPGWEGAWKDLRKGDILVVWKIDRLGRDISELFRTLREMHARGADLLVLTMNLDTRTATGRLIFGILALVAQWERELGIERTVAGLKSARARNRIGGRKRLLTDEMTREAHQRWQAGEDLEEIRKEHGVVKTVQAYHNRFTKLELPNFTADKEE